MKSLEALKNINYKDVIVRFVDICADVYRDIFTRQA